MEEKLSALESDNNSDPFVSSAEYNAIAVAGSIAGKNRKRG
jgi:hypothetical protein